MDPEHILAIAQVQPVVQTTEGVIQPAPTIQQEHVSDDVFSPEVQRGVMAVMGVHTGMVLLQHIIAEAAPPPEEEPEPLRKKPTEPETPE